MKIPVTAIYKNYSVFKEKRLHGLQVRHEEILPLLKQASELPGIHVQQIGESFRGLPIHKVEIGEGSKSVLAWCQMHGNEATATKALFDFIGLVKFSPDWSKEIFSKVKLTVIPMLNPDGADAFTRHNAQGIDINRDGKALRSPEAKILMDLFNQCKPEVCLNLHDQRSWYNVGGTSLPATLSFLAPAADEANSINETRLRAMQIVASIDGAVSKEFKIGVARYSDSYEDRAFGDTFQSMGASTILFEAGGYLGDWERDYVRKTYLFALASCLEVIADGSYESKTTDDYFNIPVNEEKLYEWIIRGASIQQGNRKWICDIGGRREYEGSKQGKGIIEEIGDLTGYFGYEEIDGAGCELAIGKTYDKGKSYSGSIEDLISDGFTTIKADIQTPEVPFKINYQKSDKTYSILPGQPANLLLLKNGNIEKVLLNGFVLSPGQRFNENYYGVSLG